MTEEGWGIQKKEKNERRMVERNEEIKEGKERRKNTMK